MKERLALAAVTLMFFGGLMGVMGLMAAPPQPLPLWCYRLLGYCGYGMVLASVLAIPARGEIPRICVLGACLLSGAALAVFLVMGMRGSGTHPSQFTFLALVAGAIWGCGNGVALYSSAEVRRHFGRGKDELPGA